jgi:hypothetical protein
MLLLTLNLHLLSGLDPSAVGSYAVLLGCSRLYLEGDGLVVRVGYLQ